jgi:hypothetical protein
VDGKPRDGDFNADETIQRGSVSLADLQEASQSADWHLQNNQHFLGTPLIGAEFSAIIGFANIYAIPEGSADLVLEFTDALRHKTGITVGTVSWTTPEQTLSPYGTPGRKRSFWTGTRMIANVYMNDAHRDVALVCKDGAAKAFGSSCEPLDLKDSALAGIHLQPLTELNPPDFRVLGTPH